MLRAIQGLMFYGSLTEIAVGVEKNTDLSEIVDYI